MLNMIKMDVYRMFCTKSMYVIWIILLASALLTSFLSKIDYDAANKEWEQQQAVESNKEQLSQQNADNVNIGMSVELPTEPGKKVTVMDVFFSNAQGKFYALFLVIFAVMFATADIKSGYIKNIGGQVSQRGMLIVSRAVALALFTAITFAGIFVFQAAYSLLPGIQISLQLPLQGYLYSRQQRICLRLNVWCGVTGRRLYLIS